MLKPLFELFEAITIQYSFVYTVQMQKKNPTKNKNWKTQTLLQKNRHHLSEAPLRS